MRNRARRNLARFFVAPFLRFSPKLAAGFTHPNARLAASFIPHPGAPLDDARHTLQCQRHVRIGQAVLAGRLGLFGGNPVIRIMIWAYRAQVFARTVIR